MVLLTKKPSGSSEKANLCIVGHLPSLMHRMLEVHGPKVDLQLQAMDEEPFVCLVLSIGTLIMPLHHFHVSITEEQHCRLQNRESVAVI